MKCDAKAKSTGKTCRRPAVPGLKKCRIHCGLSKQRQAEVKEEHETRTKVGAMLAREHVTYTEGQELDGLLIEVARSAWAVNALSREVRELEAIHGPNHLGDGAIEIRVKMWNEERERHARFCKMALEAGVAERQVQVTEQMGALFAGVFEAFIADPELKLTAAQRKRAPKVARRHLELVAG